MGTAERSLILRAAALLLSYPDDTVIGRVELLRQLAGRLSAPAAAPLVRFLGYLTSAPPEALEAAFVDTFDLRRRCSLYLTYYAFGDTRRRGSALLAFSQAYRAAGAERVGEELADHLGVVCEFAADHPGPGLDLLAEHRAGVELLRMALDDAGSPYRDVVDLVRAALPEPAPRDIEQALALARSGPPEEQVGLEPFAPPEYMGGRR